MDTQISYKTLEDLVSETPDNTQIGLICRSPGASIAQDVCGLFSSLADRAIDVSAVFYKLRDTAETRAWLDAYRAAFGTDAAVGQIRSCTFGSMKQVPEQVTSVGYWQWSGARLKSNRGTAFLDGDLLNGQAFNKDVAMLSAFGFSSIFRNADTLAHTVHRRRVEGWLNETAQQRDHRISHPAARPQLQAGLARTAQ